MNSKKKFIVSHAPFWHYGSSVSERSYHWILAALPAVIIGLSHYGIGALAVVTLSVSTAIFWELAFNVVSKRPITIADGNAALMGLIFAMLVPATFPWWAVLVGTFVVVVIGKHIFGGIGANAFHPVVLATAILSISWPHLLDFDAMLVNYDFSFYTVFPPLAIKYWGPGALDHVSYLDLLLGRQVGGVGTTFGLGLIAGGIYLILRGFVRWEIPLSFLAGVFVTALLFHMASPETYAGPLVHLLVGYTLIGAFFLAPEDASSPVNFVPMLIYGATGGVLTVLIRNIGAYTDGVIYAILVINLINPLIDKIRPKAVGKVV
jgi:electron transport complex protein RnfD